MLKSLIIALIFLAAIPASAQYSSAQIDSLVLELKKNTIIDRNDTEVISILNRLYDEILQSDKGELEPETPEILNSFLQNNGSKNSHILALFLIYQDYFTQLIHNDISESPDYQLLLILKLEAEIKNLYDEIPVIIYVYKAEAYETKGLRNEARTVLQEGLKKYSNSIPLKVYTYLYENEAQQKEDLVNHHSEHWMVKQFGIR